MEGTVRRNQRSEAAKAYRRLYATKRWKLTRAEQLRHEPLCRMCAEAGRVTAATVCDHTDPRSKDTEEGFFAGPFQSLCAPHHDGRKQQQERRGYATEVGSDGFPTDPAHPFWGGGWSSP